MAKVALYGDAQPTVWIRALRDHTYEGRAVPAGTVYLAHEHIVETIESIGMGRREPAPRLATRTPKP